MKDLGKWQLISLLSRGTAMAFGIVQSIVIVRILTEGEWGLVQIAVSIGGAFGIYQHLGLASGSTREISAAKSDNEIFRIFLTATFIRYLITLPIAVFLFFSADYLANQEYFKPALVLPIQIYSIVLIAQGVQSILNSVISGTKRFKRLFLYQAFIAFVSMFVYVPFIYLYRVNGYFYALLIFNIISSVILTYLAFKPLKVEFVMPTRHEFKLLFKELFSISLAIYLVKIIYTMWEKSGPILLGRSVDEVSVGIFAFALLYAKKIVAVSDAITDVNLPVLSEKYINNIEEFRSLFSGNFNKVFSLIMLAAFSAIYWAPQAILLAVGEHKYLGAYELILPMVFAFIFYSFINLIKSSVFIPAKLIKEMVFGFVALLIATVVFYYLGILHLGFIKAMTYGMLLGSFVGLYGLNIFSKLKLKLTILNIDHLMLMIQALAIASVGTVGNIYVKMAFFPIFVLLFCWGVFESKFITLAEITETLADLKTHATTLLKRKK